MKQRIGIFVLTLFFVFSLTPISGYASDLTPNGDFCTQAQIDCWATKTETFYVCRNNDTYVYTRTTYRCADGSSFVYTSPEELYLPGACPYSIPND